jgi:magnesium transporter
MDSQEMTTAETLTESIERALAQTDLAALAEKLAALRPEQVIDVIERLSMKQRAVVYRLLPKGKALQVFEGLDPTLQSDLVRGLKDEDVAAIFAGLDPDDRVGLMDELPATVARRLMEGLPDQERSLTAEILGYAHGSIGRRMSPEYAATYPDRSVSQTLDHLMSKLESAATVYTLPVIDRERRLTGLVGLRDLMRAEPGDLVADIMQEPHSVTATSPAETAARRCADLKLFALPVVDSETRLVGILTVDDSAGARGGRHRGSGTNRRNRAPSPSVPLHAGFQHRQGSGGLASGPGGGGHTHRSGAGGFRSHARADGGADSVHPAADRHRRQHRQPGCHHRHPRPRAGRRRAP